MKQTLLILTSLFLIILTQNAYSENSTQENLFEVEKYFTSSGWMGDGEKHPESIEFIEAYRDDKDISPCIKISYEPPPKGERWAGIYWQNEPDNWGDEKGENFSKKKYKEISFWARGETGNEVVEFKAGGINEGKYKDSFKVKTGKVYLKKDWTQYSISLEDQKLKSVIGGFCWVASKSANPGGLTFYLTQIHYK